MIKTIKLPTGTYEFRWVNDHIVFNSPKGDQILVDTGAPVNVGHPGTQKLQIGDRQANVYSAMGAFNIPTIREGVGAKIDLLLGIDGLALHTVVIDDEKRIITFGEESAFTGWRWFPTTRKYGTTVRTARVFSKLFPVFLDTGSAGITYVHPETVAGLPVLEEKHDFFPGYGNFTTPVYRVPIGIDDLTMTLRCGVLPEGLSSTLLGVGEAKRIILGNEILKYADLGLDYTTVGEPAIWYRPKQQRLQN